MRYIIGALGLVALWLLMSGVYKPVQITAGFLSSALAVWIAFRMNQTDGTPNNYRINGWRYFKYIGWLMWEIAKSNVTVARVVLSPTSIAKPNVIRFPFSQKTDVGVATFANSITLTPGTLTVEVGRKRFLVHAIKYTPGDVEELAEMDRRVTATEIS
ncbi:MAG: Na+/H+ antiporter subunit E [Pseudomonadota bacterium]